MVTTNVRNNKRTLCATQLLPQFLHSDQTTTKITPSVYLFDQRRINITPSVNVYHNPFDQRTIVAPQSNKKVYHFVQYT